MTQGAAFQHVAAELRLYCGGDSLAALGNGLKRKGCGRAVVVSGRSVAKSGAMALLRSALGPVLAGESQSVQPNSPVPAVPVDLVREAALNTLSTAVEALESSKCDPVSEAMLMHALRLVARNLDRIDADDIAGREYLAVAAVLCGRGTDQSGGGLSSVLAHAIGHRAHVSNGIVNAIVLPHTMRFNAPATELTTARIADSLHYGQAGSAADVLESLLEQLPIPHRLREIGIPEAELDAIAQAAMGDFFVSRSPRRVQGVEELRAILAAAW
jgi:alcohol dehydrogenase